MPWLLDTNVLSELTRPRANARIVSFVAETPLDELFISLVTVAELRYGVTWAPGLERRDELQLWLAKTIRPMFDGRVFELSEEILLRWRTLADDGQRRGRTFSQPDLLIAATVQEHGLTLVTRNVKDFTGLEIAIFNPWDERP